MLKDLASRDSEAPLGLTIASPKLSSNYNGSIAYPDGDYTYKYKERNNIDTYLPDLNNRDLSALKIDNGTRLALHNLGYRPGNRLDISVGWTLDNFYKFTDDRRLGAFGYNFLGR